jgi:hypothetical protein
MGTQSMIGSARGEGRAPRVVTPILLAAVLVFTVVALAGASSAAAWTPKPVKSDQNVFMPGSQPGSTTLESSGRCDNCHAGYDAAVEPATNQYGSMMAQAARDPLWLACLAVGAQDSIWAVGNPNATDICIRCHTPGGWLGGRSDPTNTSALTGNDFEGVTCDACHKSVDPLAQLKQPDVAADTNATAISMATTTYNRDLTVLGVIKLFDGTTPFLDAVTKLPTYYGGGAWPNYVESTSGQYYMDTGNNKSGPFYDAVARHGFDYSRWHKSKRFCGTCHDVSNPILANVVSSAGLPERQAGGSYFHVERTFSEFMLSAYGRGGASTVIPGVPTANKCQDCHMRDVTGKGCNKADAPLRTDLPLHDQTGGNAWISGILSTVATNTARYDAYNYAILSGTKYPGAKIDVAGLQWVSNELDAGRQRALQQLQQAATLSLVDEQAESLALRVRNNTGHKLISGFPEGRRMFLNVKFYGPNNLLLSEINPYVPLQTYRNAQGNDVYVSGGDLASRTEELIWECQTASSITGEEHTFHFALADSRYKDNRIPPKGFDAAAMNARMAQPRWHGADAPAYFSGAEYSGGYDDVSVTKPAGTVRWTATLNYQKTSKEYIEFLRDEIKGTGNTLPGGATTYIAQTDAFFTGLKGWGDAIYDLWLHNGGSAPVQMAQLAVSDTTAPETFAATDTQWHAPPYSFALAATDRGSGVAATQWQQLGRDVQSGGTVSLGSTSRVRDGKQTVTYWSVDVAGNVEEPKYATVNIDGSPPTTWDDSDGQPHTGDVTVRFRAYDGYSGLAQTSYAVDGEPTWHQGSQVTIPAAGNAGTHSIWYYSTDQVGNVEPTRVTWVQIAEGGAGAPARIVVPSWRLDPLGPATPRHKAALRRSVVFASARR